MQHRLLWIERGERIDDGGQRLVVDLDQLQRILGEVAVGGDNDRDRLADIAHALDRDRPALDRRLYADDEARRQRGDLSAGENGRDAECLARRRSVDGADFRMRVRRAQDRGVQRAGTYAEVVDEAAAPDEQRGIFDTLNRLAAPACCHSGHPTSRPLFPRKSPMCASRGHPRRKE